MLMSAGATYQFKLTKAFLIMILERTSQKLGRILTLKDTDGFDIDNGMGIVFHESSTFKA